MPTQGGTMQCWSCHGETPDSKPFCANCGAAIAQLCPSCGSELIAGKPFCANCGAAVSNVQTSAVASARIAPSSSDASAVIAERRLCSVLFVDLVGFTPLAEQQDP